MRRTLGNVFTAWLVLSCVCLGAEHASPAGVSQQIDELVEQGYVAAGLESTGSCTDREFLRRVWLDLAGRTPPLAEVKASQAGIDRSKLVQRLLKSEDFARHWGRLWTEYLTDRRPFETEGYDGRRLLQFLTDFFRENRPYSELVSDLVLGEGTSDVSGSANFLLRYNAEPVPLAGAVSQKFLGLSLQCAECHDHPHAPWKQKDFWGLAAHFARLRKMTPTNPEEGESFFVVIERPRGELVMVDKRAQPNEAGQQPKKTVFPQLPGSPRSDASKQRRAVLVEWLTQAENPYLAPHLVNLIWERLLGEGLVQNLDHWPANTTSTNTQLVNLLASDLVRHDWNVARLIEVISLSDTYQRSCYGRGETRESDLSKLAEQQLEHWARGRIRPLTADQLHLSIGQAIGYHHDENDHRLAESTGEEFTQDIPRNNLGSLSFTLERAVALYNSDYIRGASDLGTEAVVRLYGPAAGAEHIERLFQALLARSPTTEELEFFQDLGSEGEARQGLQDIIWVLLNSSEFVTNH